MRAIVRYFLPRLQDPRGYQIIVLSLLLGYGIAALDFGIHWQNAVAILVTAQVVQFIGMRATGQRRFDPISALITSLSLTLLLRTDVIALAMLAACIAIGSKFLVRVRGKHVFNPANIALVSLMLISAERRFADLRVFHDLGSEDITQHRWRPNPVRCAGRIDRLHDPVCFL